MARDYCCPETRPAHSFPAHDSDRRRIDRPCLDRHVPRAFDLEADDSVSADIVRSQWSDLSLRLRESHPDTCDRAVGGAALLAWRGVVLAGHCRRSQGWSKPPPIAHVP